MTTLRVKGGLVRVFSVLILVPVLVSCGGGGGGGNPGTTGQLTISASQPENSVLAGTPISFRVSSSDAGADLSAAQWNLGNGELRTGEWAVTSYAAAGPYTVTVTLGVSQAALDVTVVIDSPPTPNITAISPLSGTTPFNLILDGSGSIDAEGPIELLIWEVRTDPNNATAVDRYPGQQLNFMINNPGTYYVYLSAIDSVWREVTSAPIEVSVTGFPLSMLRSPSITPDEGLALLPVTADLGPPALFGSTVEWTFGDGGTGTGPSTSYVYATSGVFLPWVTQTRTNGAVQTWDLPRIQVSATIATGPARPVSGPGSADYPYPDTPNETVITNSLSGKFVSIYEPMQSGAPVPGPLPVVFFCSGGLVSDPSAYGAWISHLTRRGAIVIFPVWADAFGAEFDIAVRYDELFQGFLDALNYLQATPGTSVPDLSRVGYIGHSAGGGASTEMAGRGSQQGWGTEGAAIVSCAPWNTAVTDAEPDIHPWTYVQIQVYSHDNLAGDRIAVQQFHRLRQIPPGRRRYFRFRSDAYGSPATVGNHFTPNADAVDMTAVEIGMWRQTDAVFDLAWNGNSANLALENDGLDLGQWSDGTPVTPLQNLSDPSPMGPARIRWD